MEELIVDYIIDDFGNLIKDGLSNNENEFPMTKALSNYLLKTSLQPTIISGIMYDILIREYIEYVMK